MIKLVPVESGEMLTKLCKTYAVDCSEHVHAYVSADRALKAQCLFSLEGYTVTLLAIEFDAIDPLIPELLIRAVGSYAANRSGYIFNIASDVGKTIEPTLHTLHFEKTQTGYSGKVPKILAGTCRCNDHTNN